MGGMEGGKPGQGTRGSPFLTASSLERVIGSEAMGAFPIRAHLTVPTQRLRPMKALGCIVARTRKSLSDAEWRTLG